MTDLEELARRLQRLTDRVEQQERFRSRFNRAVLAMRLVLTASNLPIAKRTVQKFLVSEDVDDTPVPLYLPEQVDELSDEVTALLLWASRVKLLLQAFTAEHVLRSGVGKCSCGRCAQAEELIIELHSLGVSANAAQRNLARSATT